MRYIITYALAFVFLSNCSTPYQSRGLAGGYQETWLTDREVKINFSGNGYTSSGRAANFTALRACELTLEKGYTHFIVLDEESDGFVTESQVTPDRTTVTPDGFGGATATTTQGQTVSFFKPTTDMNVYFIKESEVDSFRSQGFRPISAKFYVEHNASEKLQGKILGPDPSYSND